jgi:hypothetical protein
MISNYFNFCALLCQHFSINMFLGMNLHLPVILDDVFHLQAIYKRGTTAATHSYSRTERCVRDPIRTEVCCANKGTFTSTLDRIIRLIWNVFVFFVSHKSVMWTWNGVNNCCLIYCKYEGRPESNATFFSAQFCWIKIILSALRLLSVPRLCT